MAIIIRYKQRGRGRSSVKNEMKMAAAVVAKDRSEWSKLVHFWPYSPWGAGAGEPGEGGGD